jgi:hypothetical protein
VYFLRPRSGFVTGVGGSFDGSPIAFRQDGPAQRMQPFINVVYTGPIEEASEPPMPLMLAGTDERQYAPRPCSTTPIVLNRIPTSPAND